MTAGILTIGVIVGVTVAVCIWALNRLADAVLDDGPAE